MGSESTLLPTNGSASFADIKLDPSATAEFYKLVGDPLSITGYKSTEPLPALFERVVKGDDPKAMVMLGEKHLLGRDWVFKDVNRAADLFIKAADLNDRVAMVFLFWVALAAQENVDVLNAVVERVRRAAENKMPEALYSLGMMYGWKYGHLGDPAHTCKGCINTEEWNKRAKRAKELLRESANLGNPFALVARMHSPKKYPPDYIPKQAEELVFPFTEQAIFDSEKTTPMSNSGSVFSESNLACSASGKSQFFNLFGYRKKEERCKKAIAMGNIHGYCALWILHGRQEQDENLKKGANAGDLACMTELARTYSYKVRDVIPQANKAIEWYEKCAEYDSTVMQKIGDILFETGRVKQACTWYKKLYWNGLLFAWQQSNLCCKIATMYKEGCPGLAPNPKRSVKWLEMAAEIEGAMYSPSPEVIEELIQRINTGSDGHIRDLRESSRWKLYLHRGWHY